MAPQTPRPRTEPSTASDAEQAAAPAPAAAAAAARAAVVKRNAIAQVRGWRGADGWPPRSQLPVREALPLLLSRAPAQHRLGGLGGACKPLAALVADGAAPLGSRCWQPVITKPKDAGARDTQTAEGAAASKFGGAPYLPAGEAPEVWQLQKIIAFAVPWRIPSAAGGRAGVVAVRWRCDGRSGRCRGARHTVPVQPSTARARRSCCRCGSARAVRIRTPSTTAAWCAVHMRQARARTEAELRHGLVRGNSYVRYGGDGGVAGPELGGRQRARAAERALLDDARFTCRKPDKLSGFLCGPVRTPSSARRVQQVRACGWHQRRLHARAKGGA